MTPDLIFLIAMLGLCFGSMALFGMRFDHTSHDPLESKERGTFVLGGFVRSWFLWFIGPLVALALKARLSHPKCCCDSKTTCCGKHGCGSYDYGKYDQGEFDCGEYGPDKYNSDSFGIVIDEKMDFEE